MPVAAKTKGGDKRHSHSPQATGYTPTLSLGCLETGTEDPEEESKNEVPEHFSLENDSRDQQQESRSSENTP